VIDVVKKVVTIVKKATSKSSLSTNVANDTNRDFPLFIIPDDELSDLTPADAGTLIKWINLQAGHEMLFAPQYRLREFTLSANSFTTAKTYQIASEEKYKASGRVEKDVDYGPALCKAETILAYL